MHFILSFVSFSFIRYIYMHVIFFSFIYPTHPLLVHSYGNIIMYLFIFSFTFSYNFYETHSFLNICVALKRAVVCKCRARLYFEVVYFVTALVPSLTACFASSPGRRRRTAVCISRLLMVDFLLYWANREDSPAIRSKMSLTKLFMIVMARLETPVSGWTCFRTL